MTLATEGRPGPILVVEDDDAIRLSVEIVLSNEGYEVLGAPDGLTGLRLAEERHPSLILLDLWLPCMDGASFASRYLKTPGPHAPIVLTSAGEPHAGEAAPGVAAVLPKPYAPSRLIEIMRQYVGPAAAQR